MQIGGPSSVRHKWLHVDAVGTAQLVEVGAPATQAATASSPTPAAPAMPDRPGPPRPLLCSSHPAHTSQQVDKHRIVTALGIRYRDLLALDPSVPIPFPAAILIREKALVVNLETVRLRPRLPATGGAPGCCRCPLRAAARCALHIMGSAEHCGRQDWLRCWWKWWSRL